MRKNRSKITFVFIILIFSLASISISYAGWTDTIYLEGNISTWEEPGSISDYVWLDMNQNGIQDPGEPGIEGIIVNLYMSDGSFVATTTTDEFGFYIFDNLSPGEYYLEFILPDNYSFTTSNSGSDDEVDSDADPITGYTAVTNLTPGENDISWDAGVFAEFEGCSHGFWKNHHSHWQEYASSDLIGNIFTIPTLLNLLSDDTLEQALDYSGGDDLYGAARILLRNAVASLLNAVHSGVLYPMTESQVISEVDAALASEDRDIILNLEITLDNYNNLGGCLCN